MFADRDRTADSVVRVAHGLWEQWEQWGPRRQSILKHTVKSLHEANERMEADRQYTILDGSLILSDDKFRKDVLAKVSDRFLLRWWARDFLGWRHETRSEALAPVQTRLAYYASSKKARAILGQSRSTIDIRKTILEGGILLVSTAQGSVGRDVAALVGASLLNLVDSVAVMANQARSQAWQAVQFDPARRASRFFRHDERLHSVRPDAFGVVKRGGEGEALLPGVGAPSGAAGYNCGPYRALPALLCRQPAPGRPRRHARRASGLRRRHRRRPLSASGGRWNEAGRGQGAPVGVPQGSPGKAGAAGRGLAEVP